ncbi:MAG: substrate-binding periplasmic protein [Bdellovibrionales bacterium]
MHPKIHTFLLVVAVFLLGFMALRPSGTSESEPAKKSETAFERVMRTRTIRCAYGYWPLRFMMDPVTKELSGTDYEIMEEIGRITGLKIVWDSEFAGPGVIPDQLATGKQDACCVGLWSNARRAQRLEFSVPIDYMPLYAYTREGDTRFDHNLAAINDGAVTIALAEGTAQKAVADSNFPKAKQNALAQDQSSQDAFLMVAMGKADIVFSDSAGAYNYNLHNPSHKLYRVLGDKPIKVFSNVLTTAKGETALRDLLSTALQELQSDGTVDRILNKYETEPGMVLRVATPYKTGE